MRSLVLGEHTAGAASHGDHLDVRTGCWKSNNRVSLSLSDKLLGHNEEKIPLG